MRAEANDASEESDEEDESEDFSENESDGDPDAQVRQFHGQVFVLSSVIMHQESRQEARSGKRRANRQSKVQRANLTVACRLGVPQAADCRPVCKVCPSHVCS